MPVRSEPAVSRPALAELYEKATKAGIRGRSGTNHDELTDALAKGS